jgi:hypothetical protein
VASPLDDAAMRTLAAIALLLTACSSGPTAHDACAQLATAQCDKLDACITNGTSQRYTDKATCVARLMASCTTSLAAADTANNPDNVIACATAVPTASCDDYIGNDVVACAPLMGKRALGSPCAYPAQCQSAVCAIAKGTNCGSCAAPSSAGDSCATASCSRGFTCVAGTQTCQTPGGSGASCDDNHPCGFRLSCVVATGATSGSCEAAGTTAGTACDPRREAAPGCANNAGLVCDSATKQCLAATFSGPGGACGLSGGKVVLCDMASVCFGASGATPGTCKAIALEGQPCDGVAGPSCMAPARCVTGSATSTAGTCQLPDPGVCG